MLRAQKQEQIERENSPQTNNKPQKKTHKIKRKHNNRQITQYFPKLERKPAQNLPTSNLQQKSGVEQIDQTSLKLHEQEQALSQKRDQMLHLLQVQKEERDHYLSRIKNIVSQQLKKMVEIDRILKKHSLTQFSQMQEQRYNLVLEINQKQDILNHEVDGTLRRIFLQKEMIKLKKELKELDYKIAITQEEQRLAIQQDNCYFAKQKWPVLNKRYQILRLIGKGGFSQVYQAYDLQNNVRVAVKLSEVQHLLAGRENKNDYLRHIKRQYQVHKMLSHPSIVQLIQVLQIDNAICIVLEYCQGETLAQMLKRQSQIQQKYAKLIIRQLLEVVKYLSMQKPSVVHYDLKPQNIMFQYGVPKVLDFGVCKTIDSEHSKMALTSQGVGTHCYLPPETFAMSNPTLSNKVDIWSIGVIFYQMLYGFRPFGQIGFPVSEEIDFPMTAHISQEAKRFMRQCLRINLKERSDPISALKDTYFSK